MRLGDKKPQKMEKSEKSLIFYKKLLMSFLLETILLSHLDLSLMHLNKEQRTNGKSKNIDGRLPEKSHWPSKN